METHVPGHFLSRDVSHKMAWLFKSLPDKALTSFSELS